MSSYAAASWTKLLDEVKAIMEKIITNVAAVEIQMNNKGNMAAAFRPMR
jgi:hypothetical protein